MRHKYFSKLFAVLSLFLCISTFPAFAGSDGLEWMQLYDEVAEPRSFGLVNGGEFGVAECFDVEFLRDYAGKEFSVLSVFLAAPLEEVNVFVKKGADINTAETLAAVEIPFMGEGWNYVRLNEPIKIEDTSPLYLGYEAIDDANSPIGCDGKAVLSGQMYYSMFGRAYEDEDKYGDLMIGALVAGDSSEIPANVTLSTVSCNRYVPKGGLAEFELLLANTSFKDVEAVTLSVQINGIYEEVELALKPADNGNSMIGAEFSYEVHEDTEFVFRLVKVDGVEILSDDEIKKEIEVYDGDKAVQRIVLIEKFTGQNCGFCPGGENSIAEAMSGLEDFVARIDHHYGYGKDIFTISESESIGSFFGVTSAPQCMLDRTIQEDRKDFDDANNGVKWHPGLMTAEILKNEISKPAFVSLDVSSSYDTGSGVLYVTVKGKSNIDLVGKRINVVLTQSGYDAYQNSGWEGYLHNDFPIDFLTDYTGDILVVANDGTFEMNFSCEIKEAYGRVETDRGKLKLVAFVSNWNTAFDSEVLQAVSVDVDGRASVNDANGEKCYDVNVVDRSIRILGESVESFRIYDLSGKMVGNADLAEGLYIVEVFANGGRFVDKVMMP